MSKPGDRLKELCKDKDVVEALGTMVQLPMDDLIICCAFLVKLYSPNKISASYLS